MKQPPWSERRERGNVRLVRLMIRLSLTFGWATGQLLIYPAALYFFLFSRHARAASRGFLARALSRAPNAADVLHHIFSYSCVLFDRIFLLADRTGGFAIDEVGLAELTTALAQSRGCLLFGAHLGSFEALRCVARQSPVPVKLLMYRDNSGPYTTVVETLDPSFCPNIIDIGKPDSMLRVRESLQRGEMVGILADRSAGGDKMLTVPFLGAPAAFPTGPIRLAAALGAPVVLVFGIRTGPRRYRVYFEHFADRVALDQGDRVAQTTMWLQRYTSRLEHYCRRYPFNWFNFYDFWDVRPQSSAAPAYPALRGTPLPVPARGRRSRLSVADR